MSIMNRNSRPSWLLATVLLVLSPGSIVHAKKSAKDQPLPSYPVGITGLYVVPQREQPHVVVDSTEPGSPAAGKFEKGDVIVAANDTPLALPDSRVQLGNAITQAEAKTGELMFTVKRGGTTRQVAISLPVLGPYSKTWPIDCAKSRKIVEQTAAHTVRQFKDGTLTFPGRAGALGILFLLSTGDDQYLPVCREVVRAYAESVESVRSHTWNNGFLSIALGEYYLRTGDKAALKPMQMIADDSYGRMTCGGWGHWDYPNPGYVRSGLVNAAGGKLFVGMMLAREAGVKMDEAAVKKNVHYFFRFAGFGGVPYGDQRPGGGAATNGKSGMAGVGLGLLPDPCYQTAAQQFAVEQADSAFGFEGGHTGNMTNVLWRNLSIPLVPADMRHHYRHHMDTLRWYYELCRHPKGGFRMLPTIKGESRYAAEEWGLCAALGYTTGWKKLRLCGAPPTRFSKIKPLGQVMKKDPAFLIPRHAEGCKESDFEDLQTIFSHLKWDARRPYYKRRSDPNAPLIKRDESDQLPSINYIVKHFRHYNPAVRANASYAIGYHGDAAIPALLKAMRSADARVRRAAVEGLSGQHSFFMETSPFTYTPAGLDRLVPHLVRILQNPQSDMWEVEGALWAMSMADKKTIARHLALLKPFLSHEEWWVRSAAFVAISEAHELAATAMGDLVQAFAKSSHVSARNDYGKRLTRMINEDQIAMTPTVRRQAVQMLGEDLVDLTDRERSYVKRGTGYYDISNIRVLLLFKPEELALITDHINRELARIGDPDIQIINRTNYQNLAWLLIGDDWGNPGLINVIDKMGYADRAKLMPGLKALLAGGLDKMFKPTGKGKAVYPQVQQLKKRVRDMLDAHEAKQGKVRPCPVR